MSAALDLDEALAAGGSARPVFAVVRDRPTRRGTSNRDERGSSYDRRARRAWLLSTFGDGTTAPCYRCGTELTEETLTVDRIIPGRDGGTYRRGNIRPACAGDNSELGGALANGRGRPLVIGVDPGPTPGFGLVLPDGTAQSVQCTAGVFEAVLRALILSGPRLDVPGDADTPAVSRLHVIVAVERYVVGGLAAKAKAKGANEATRSMVGAVGTIAGELGAVLIARPAADVRPWATAGDPPRVERAGLAPKGMTHARSGGWHALYAAVHDAGHPDPLSRRGRAQKG